MLFKTHTLAGAKYGPNLLITAGIHGDEYEGVEAIQRLIQRVKPKRLRGTLTLVPVANESAYERKERTGEDGLDLARTFPGSYYGSLTERVAYELNVLIGCADAYIDLHSGGNLYRLSPLVGYMLVKDPDVLEEQRAMARVFGLSTVWGTSSELHGRSMSAARDLGVPAIYAEYLGGGTCSTDGVDAYYHGCLNVMALLGMISHTAPVVGPDLEVEDSKPDSGHLQIRHCAPVDGSIDYAVSLGDEVQEGDVLATLTSDDGACRSVHADSAGRVICVHAHGRVATGESMAVILEYNSRYKQR